MVLVDSVCGHTGLTVWSKHVGKNEGEWTVKVAIRTLLKFLAGGEIFLAIF